MTNSPHVLKARNVHIGSNKNKILLLLYSSKTHDESSLLQKIKISANDVGSGYVHRHYCPFKLMRQFLDVRGAYQNDNEQFFIFKDKNLVTPSHVRNLLKTIITRIGLNNTNYGMHSFRIGRTTDLIKYGYLLEQVRIMGRWKSNVIYKYIR